MTSIGCFINDELLTDDICPQDGSNPATGKSEKTVSLSVSLSLSSKKTTDEAMQLSNDHE